MHYTYTLDEKDFKEASFNSVHVLKFIQRSRILYSIFYSLLLFVLLPFLGVITDTPLTTRVSIFIVGYVILSTIMYFWAYQERLFNIDRKRRGAPKKWTVQEEVSLFEDKLVESSNHVQKTIYWKDIAGVYETNNNLILYLDSKILDFLVIKKPNQTLKNEEEEKFFHLLRQKID